LADLSSGLPHKLMIALQSFSKTLFVWKYYNLCKQDVNTARPETGTCWRWMERWEESTENAVPSTASSLFVMLKILKIILNCFICIS